MAEDDNISLNTFTAVDRSGQVQAYIEALEAFDRIPQLQELKRLEKESIPAVGSVLDVGCGFGLETLRFARRGNHPVCGLDRSGQFVAEANRRAAEAAVRIEYTVGSADALPYGDASFDHVRAERLLIYFENVRSVLAEMHRVLRPGGSLSLIEPDFGSTTVNLGDKALVRRVMACEADHAVAQSGLPGVLGPLLRSLNFEETSIATRVLVFPPDLAADYFIGAARKAAAAGAISSDELKAWRCGISELHRSGDLFGTEGYFLFLCRK